MRTQTNAQCIDMLMRKIEKDSSDLVGEIKKASGVKLRRDAKSRVVDDSEPGHLCVYDIFNYKNGRGEKAQIAVNSGYNRNNDQTIGRCVDLYLLDVPDANDPRVRAYLGQYFGGKEPRIGEGLSLGDVGYMDKPDGVVRRGIVLSDIGEGLSDKQKEFLGYVMKSNAR